MKKLFLSLCIATMIFGAVPMAAAAQEPVGEVQMIEEEAPAEKSVVTVESIEEDVTAADDEESVRVQELVVEEETVPQAALDVATPVSQMHIGYLMLAGLVIAAFLLMMLIGVIREKMAEANLEKMYTQVEKLKL